MNVVLAIINVAGAIAVVNAWRRHRRRKRAELDAWRHLQRVRG